MKAAPLTLRHPKQEDAQAVCDLVIACDIEDFGTPDFDLGELLDMWAGLDLGHNVWIAERDGGTLAGYAFLEEDSDEKLFSCGFIHPSARGTGVGSALLDAVEQRARMLSAASGQRKRLQNVIPTQRQDAADLVSSRGFVPVRYFKRLGIRMESAPQLPDVPQGITLNPFAPDRDEREVYEAYIESFADHWDFAAPAYDAWLEKTRLPSFSPAWWIIARGENREVAGFALGRMREDTLYINQIGVRSAYRGRGLGSALLQQAFHSSYAAGQPSVSLGVDASNTTGAYRLYEKAGMKSVYEITIFEKVIEG
ncbi:MULTISPECIES: GNAT family N-acetyltransferase [Paenibacillus]|uniref:GNAT family N-acetyltransferase n=1 Tax=Paenibacillus TaxID=44249 RepID=UPI0022B90A6E|nr:GNAT family N-acetyltransferase [Paenibacillus caseinilyticus]MCZ8521785.1 GNAT family N-acetyltransferase [Paenibacillus caseinilyticus]